LNQYFPNLSLKRYCCTSLLSVSDIDFDFPTSYQTDPPSDRRLSAKLVPTFADRGCHVVSVTDPYGCIFGFLDQSNYFFFHVAPELYSEAEWAPLQTHYLTENLVAPEIEPGPPDL
jgi:hypothetical protein